ncbi:MAG: hypothetical protein JF615_13180 [Asticcacaulis sp.]|nr:hypothetical protein [Asticcacaulis sp.]
MTPLEVSLARLAAVAPAAPWWLIGSVAAKLCGIDLEPEDVDVCASESIIEAMLTKLGVEPETRGQNDRFRSSPFCRVPVEGGLPIEVMGDLHVRQDGAWRPLVITTRLPVAVAGGTVYVPSLEEQARIFELFGRPKDLAKADLIRLSALKD